MDKFRYFEVRNFQKKKDVATLFLLLAEHLATSQQKVFDLWRVNLPHTPPHRRNNKKK